MPSAAVRSSSKRGAIDRRTPEAAAEKFASCNARPVRANVDVQRSIDQFTTRKMQFNDTLVLVG
jgi:hypothetical protein